MSRTVKGGYNVHLCNSYHSRRNKPGSHCGFGARGRESKIMTHRVERRLAKKAARKEKEAASAFDMRHPYL